MKKTLKYKIQTTSKLRTIFATYVRAGSMSKNDADALLK